MNTIRCVSPFGADIGNPDADNEMVTIALPGGGEIEVYSFVAIDGVPVVVVDPQPGTPVERIRIEMQDYPIFDGTYSERHGPVDRGAATVIYDFINSLGTGAIADALRALAEVYLKGRTP